jgi:hypothetical protein
MDDCSTDNSVDAARTILGDQPVDFRIVPSKKNSGSPFVQWHEGAKLAKGTHIWIAEADDTCDADFLDEVRKGFRTPGVVVSYCESRQIGTGGNLLANNYSYYVSDIDDRHWLSHFVMDGDKEVAASLCIKNVIPNVSAVLFCRSAYDLCLTLISNVLVHFTWRGIG